MTINERIGENLTKLRKSRKMTQLELAQQIGFSDKSVSKWETGEVCPNVETLSSLAGFFGVTIDDIVNGDPDDKPAPRNYNRLCIALLAILVVWLLATVLFVYVEIITPETPDAWLLFVYAVPLSSIVALVFNSLWGRKKFNYIIISVLIWSILGAVYIQFLEYNMYALFFIGIPSEIAVILWSQLRPRNRKRNVAQSEQQNNDKD